MKTQAASKTRRSALLWLTLSGALLVSLVLTWSHQQQSEQTRRSTDLMLRLAWASEDLHKGAVHLTLAADVESPWQQDQGLVLLAQALQAYHEILPSLRRRSPAVESFRQDLVVLEAELSALREAYMTHGRHVRFDTQAQVVMQSLLDKASALTSRLAAEDRAEQAKAREGFLVNMAVATLLLAGLCVAVFRAQRSRERTEQALAASEQRMRFALEAAGDGVWDWDVASDEVQHSSRWRAMIGMAPDEDTSHFSDWYSRVHPEDRDLALRALSDAMAGRTPSYRCEYRLRHTNHSWLWVLDRGMVVAHDDEGRATRVLGTLADITPLKQAQDMVWQQAHYDPLTGLPNRRLFLTRLEQEVQKAAGGRQRVAVLFIDLDGFKEINDTLGHDAGDRLLVEVARRFAGAIRASDTLSRQGGDEFALILPLQDGADRVQDVAERLLAALRAPLQVLQDEVHITCSLGISLCPEDGSEPMALLKQADQALYAAKDAGKACYHFFQPSMQTRAVERLSLARDLRQAMTGSDFHLVYQPIVHLATGRVHKAEALLRWQHPERGSVGPGEFIPVAESTGLIVPLGHWVLRTALAQVQAWRQHFEPSFQVSVNQSPAQFKGGASGERLPAADELLRAFGMGGDALAVEITEGLLLEKNEEVQAQLLRLKQGGVCLSLDDFGTGYSSLAYLQRFDIHYLKIDRSFVSDMVAGSRNHVLCQAIVSMAHALGMEVIAEGIETETQCQLLKDAGCDHGQGFHLGRPVRAEVFEATYLVAAGQGA